MQEHYKFIISIVVSFVIALVLGYITIPWLRRLKAGQSIREDGPKSHLVKAGTPTMGGIFIILSAVIAILLMSNVSTDILILIGSTIAFGIIGFIDDFIKVVLKRNLGLRAKQKLALQIIIAVLIALYQVKVSSFGTQVFVPFVNTYLDFGIFYIPFIVFFVVAMVNSVNLTDGLDGLAGSVTVVVALFLGLTSMKFGYVEIQLFAGALVGACLGFLKYNRYPAKVFMGDTGSLALGGAISAMAILTNTALIIPLVGGIYLAEALSVIIQVGYYKKTKKRFFKMAPLHHHFELSGWNEKKTVRIFVLITLGLCFVASLILW